MTHRDDRIKRLRAAPVFADRICEECGIPEGSWPHLTDEGRDPRIRAFASERRLGIPAGTPRVGQR